MMMLAMITEMTAIRTMTTKKMMLMNMETIINSIKQRQ
jgi:hypothetical protein